MNFQHDGVLITGSWSVTGGAIVAGSIFGEGYTVVYTAAGIYTVTTRDTYRHLIAFGSNLGLTTPNVDLVTNCDLPTGGAGAVVGLAVTVFDTATATASDPAAAADRVSFWMLLSNSQLDAVR
jgi:hypothetical protein